MATAIKIKREDALALMAWLGWGTAKKWGNKRLGDKLAAVKDTIDAKGEDPEDDNVHATAIDVVAAIEDGLDFVIVDEDPEDNGDPKDAEPEEAQPEPEAEDLIEEDDDDDDWDEPENDEPEVEYNDDEHDEDGNEVEPEEEEVTEEESVQEEEEPKEPVITKDGVPKKKRGRKKKEKEPEVPKKPDMHYKTYATAVPKFVVHDDEVFNEVGDSLNTDQYQVKPNLTVAEAEQLLRANNTNRPYRKGISQRYAEDIIRKEWKRTLEPLTFDTTGEGVSLQHRLGGLLLAEKKRAKNPEYFTEAYGWNDEVTMPVTLAFGADPDGNDLQDRGQQRSAKDVLFRRSEFPDIKESDLKRLTADLAVAARLCWLKLGSKKVSDAPHFPHSELISFIEKHPKLKEMVSYVYAEDGKKDKKIVTYLKSRGYLAGLVYLFGISDTPTVGDENDWDFSKWDTAQDFISRFAAGVFEDENDPILQLREWLTKEMSKDKKPTRDMKVNMIIKVWNAYVAGESLEPKQMRFKKKEKFPIGNLV